MAVFLWWGLVYSVGEVVSVVSMRLLLIDTCGAVGSVALAAGERVVCVRTLAERGASGQLLGVISEALGEVGWRMDELEAVGVVNGPGSFTGVRVGLAAAKGLCEALGVPMAAVSRLDVLWEASGLGADGLVALEAGRGEVFVRDGSGRQSLMMLNEVGREVVVCEGTLAAKLPGVRMVGVDAGSALQAVRRGLDAGGSDVALTDANYGRGEAEIYAKKAGAC